MFCLQFAYASCAYLVAMESEEGMDLLELELRWLCAIRRTVRIEPSSSGRATSILNHCISPRPQYSFFSNTCIKQDFLQVTSQQTGYRSRHNNPTLLLRHERDLPKNPSFYSATLLVLKYIFQQKITDVNFSLFFF